MGGKQAKIFTVKAGYELLIHQLPHPQTDHIWTEIWNKDRLPKVNLFCLEFVHEKILMAENLKKRNIQGPCRCAPCEKNEESIKHAFSNCSLGLCYVEVCGSPGKQIISNTWKLERYVYYMEASQSLEARFRFFNSTMLECAAKVPLLVNTVSAQHNYILELSPQSEISGKQSLSTSI